MNNIYNTKGRISIYGNKGGILETKFYYSRNGRRDIIAKWKEEWKGLASHIQVYPFALEKEAPKPVKKKLIRVPAETPKDPLIRHAARYTNISSPYGIADELK